MNCYSKKCINLVTLLIAIIIFVQINFLFIKIIGIKQNQNATVEVKLSKLENDGSKTEEFAKGIKSVEDWNLIIPKINLTAVIKDGTEGEIINSYIGHFKETSSKQGNIGLAAHNEGYKENYFEKLYQLEKGDSIEYKKGEFEKEYQVIENKIIEETDWTYLRNTSDNRITLITCISNEPTKRRCVQAIEIE